MWHRDFNKLHDIKANKNLRHPIFTIKSCRENDGFKQTFLGNRRPARSSNTDDGVISSGL